MHPTDVASAAWVFASAPSMVPFYVAGGLLACWAVVLAATGITHPDDFPGSAGRAAVRARSARRSKAPPDPPAQRRGRGRCN